MPEHVFLTRWFLHVPLDLRTPGMVAPYDRGRKGHASEADARSHFSVLLRYGERAIAVADSPWERLGASLQHAELVRVTLVEAAPDASRLVVALLDDLAATPQPAGPSLPWRRDHCRQPWRRHERVLAHWSAPSIGDHR